MWFASKSDRHFFGHGVFSAAGRPLYATENDYERAAGVIGVRDATDSYRQIGEFPAHGMEPHDIALLSDGRTMVMVQTSTQSGYKLLPVLRLKLAKHFLGKTKDNLVAWMNNLGSDK